MGNNNQTTGKDQTTKQPTGNQPRTDAYRVKPLCHRLASLYRVDRLRRHSNGISLAPLVRFTDSLDHIDNECVIVLINLLRDDALWKDDRRSFLVDEKHTLTPILHYNSTDIGRFRLIKDPSVYLVQTKDITTVPLGLVHSQGKKVPSIF